MSNKKRTSRRKKHVPSKFEDTICDLNKCKNDDGKGEDNDASDVERVQTDEGKEEVVKEGIDKEGENDSMNGKQDEVLMSHEFSCKTPNVSVEHPVPESVIDVTDKAAPKKLSYANVLDSKENLIDKNC
ncbi:hypothetical protein Tco_0701127 [Tanacetum coccineum]